ncbi:hypothetical protein CDAR_499071 [Caerostris darwini]|uniref:Uncharacterized protein n=1 Tax=Caerostris darwini TaxID=1538125 RepID=A0AAV4TN61_9ARAC|nr:hypothetical protein CDAR_499071 [Caerostris darwini]
METGIFGNPTIKDEQSSSDYVRDMSKYCIDPKIRPLDSGREINKAVWEPKNQDGQVINHNQQSELNKAPTQAEKSTRPFGNPTIRMNRSISSSSVYYVRDMSKHCINPKIPSLDSGRKVNMYGNLPDTTLVDTFQLVQAQYKFNKASFS